MRITFILLLVTILCSLTETGNADSNSDCLIGCSNEKRSNDMYCPPAGGYSDDDHKQCMDKNAAAYNDCVKGCSPAPASPESPPPEPSLQPVESGTTDRQ
jgi:hypothetical protein